MHETLPNTPLSQGSLLLLHTCSVQALCGALSHFHLITFVVSLDLFAYRFHANSAKMRAAVSVAQAPLCVCAGVQVRAAYSPQRQIVNNNFNLIKAFIHHWRAAVPLPLAALLSLLGATPPKPSSGAPDARAKKKSAEQRCVAMKLLAAGKGFLVSILWMLL